MEPITWTTEPAPDLSREEAVRFVNGGAQADLELAFRDGVVIDYEKRMIPGPRGDTDLEIRIVFRHKSVLPDPA